MEAARGGRPLGALVDALAAARIGETFNQYRRSRLLRERLLWNVVPTHPHKSGRPYTKRRPSRVEVDVSFRFLEGAAGGRRLIAVGRLAQEVTGAAYVRHPSHGGVQAFRAGLAELIG